MLGNYLTATAKYHFERLRATSWLVTLLYIVAWVIVTTFFWLMGRQPVSLSPFPLFVLSLFFYGMWVGLRFINAHRPNGLYFVDDDHWLWYQLAKGLSMGLGIATLTIGTYYLSDLIQLNLSAIMLTSVIINIYLFFVGIICLGTLIALFIRRVSTNVFVRFVLLILAGFFALYLTSYYQTGLVNLEGRAFLSPLTPLVLPLMALFIVINFVVLLLNQLMISVTPISREPEATFWNGVVSIKLFRRTNRPAFQAVISNILYIVRSNYFQRRIFALLILFIVAPYLFDYFGFINGHALVNAIMIGGYIIAFTISMGAGAQAFMDKITFRNYPSAKNLTPTVNYLVSGVIVLLLMLLLISVTVQGLTLGDWLTIFVFTLASHTALFFAGNLAEVANRLPSGEINEGDRTVAIGIITSFILTCITLGIYGQITTYAVILIIVAWTGAAVFFLYAANRHFLKDI